MSTTENILKDRFGFKEFRQGQQQVIETIIAGRSSVCIFPTGAGKSLCYQLPALLEHGMTLVVSPLLSLMKNQIDFLKSKNIPAAKLDSAMTAEEYRGTLEAARLGKLKILMIAVERFKNERFRIQLRQMNVSMLVVDEAHCISEWGHNFRPDYLKIPLYQKEFGVEKVLLLTATATPKVIEDMCEKFAINREDVFQTGFYRKNLFLRTHPVKDEEKDALLRDRLADSPTGPAIVYVTLQKTAERISGMLKKHGLNANAYHAGMKNEEREDVQDRFMAGEVNTVVATIAFGMGIDKEDICKIIHYDLPKSIESYSQEIGRSGRDGNPSLCCLFGNKSKIPVLENFAYGDTPSFESICTVLEEIKNSTGNLFEVRAYALSRLADIRMLPLKTLLVYLEMADVISPRYTYFEEYVFKYILPAQDILGKFNDERMQFVEIILNNSTTARTWTKVDVESIVNESGSDRQRVLTALEYFHQKEWIHLQPKSSVEVFEILNPDFNRNSIARDLAGLFHEKEKKDVERLHAMIELFERDQCLAKSLSAYFGETLESDCQRCSVCMDKKPVQFIASELAPLDMLDFQDMVQPLAEIAGAAMSVTLVTRFLCGLSSPRLSEYKVRQVSGFGQLESYPYKTVEKWVDLHIEQVRDSQS